MKGTDEPMMHRLAIGLAIALLSFAMSRLTYAATAFIVYDTVDSVELNTDVDQVRIVIKGILAGASTASTRTFIFGVISAPTSFPAASRCERMALAAISKPGKYQFAIGPSDSASTGGACKLILVAP
jgi:hypothetical protein